MQYIGRFVRDEENIEILEWLVNVADFRGFDRRVLRVRRDQLREGREKRLDSSLRHFAKLARDDSYSSSGLVVDSEERGLRMSGDGALVSESHEVVASSTLQDM